MALVEEIVRGIRDYYLENVKPKLDEGNISQARRAMNNLSMKMEEHFQKLFPYHHGPTCYALTSQVQESLKGNRLPAKEIISELGMRFIQWNMSAASDNRG